MMSKVLALAVFVVLVGNGGMAAAQEFPVHLRAVDRPGGEPIHARAYLRRDGQLVLPDGLASYDTGDERHFLIPGDARFDLPVGRYELRVERGLEHRPATRSFTLTAALDLEIVVTRWVDMNAAGWYSADMHVHRDPADMAAILRAEALNLAPTITTHVWGSDVRQPWGDGHAFLTTVETDRVYTANAQEIERIEGGPGAIILLAANLPLPFDGYELYPPSATYARLVHAQGGYVEADKPFWLDTFVNVALGAIDFVEINANHFYPRGFDTDLARWSAWPQEMGYIGSRGLALWIMKLYYSILNCGFRLPLSAGSANGVKPAQVGFNRVYAKLDRFSYDGFLAAMKAGRSFTTNGPILDLVVGDGHGPGAVVTLDQDTAVAVRGTVRSQGAIDRVEVIVNGAVAETVNGEGRDRVTVAVEIPIGESSWLALRAFEVAEGHEIFGHTSPVYLLRDGQAVLVEEDARDLLDKVDQLIRYTETVQGFASDAHRDETLAVYAEARAIYRRLADGQRLRQP